MLAIAFDRRWLLVFWIGAASAWANAADQVDYLRDVKPLLSRCNACHGVLRQRSGLRLDTAPAIRRGGESGPAIVPGKSAESLLIHALTGTNGASQMPPADAGGPLTAEAIDKIRAWIDQGAQAPPETEPVGPRDHWAFRPPSRPPIPVVKEFGWVKSPIDRFVLAEHERRGLQHAPQAAKDVLLRRVYLDLIGIPPTRAELHALLADESQDAYEKVVSRLLDSPQYGERWGRHWMDVWRYSDWAGYGAEIRESQFHIWRWRDWIIESLNGDKPYDRMILEMVAGDELAPTDANVLRATGFLGRNWFKFNRNVWLDNTVEHCGKAFVGLTFNCARCHDHKFDPISQAEYYQLRAIFEPYDVRYDRVAGQPDAEKDGIARVFDKRLDDPTYVFVAGNEQTPDKEHPQRPSLPEFFGASYSPSSIPLPVDSYYPAITPGFAEEARSQLTKKTSAAEKAKQKAASDLVDLQARLEKIANGLPEASKPQPVVALADDFHDESNLWKRNGGQWDLRDGKLTQQQIVSGTSSSVSRENHPADFRAALRFKTTGGGTYKSVGMSFDVVDDGNYQAAYLSAFNAGPKLQIYQSQDGRAAYPAAGMTPQPVTIGEEQLLEIAIRGRLINVWLNGTFKLAFELGLERRPGKFSIWTYDATAEFLDVRVETLPIDEPLATAGSTEGPIPNDPAQAKQLLEQASVNAKRELELSSKKLDAAAAELESFDQRLAAERSKFGMTPAGDLKGLARAASLAEHRATLAKAEADLFELEKALATAKAAAAEKPGDEKTKKNVVDGQAKVDAGRKTLEAAKVELPAESEKYAPLGEMHPSNSTGRRLALARWLSSPDNPLTARVAINHLWLRHFGRALVPTVFDFGLNGKPPTHPELLDWLATEFMAHEWSMKHIHRLLVLSATYQQSSSVADFPAVPTEQESLDPDNRLLWRMNPRRLEAEIVRDSLLSVAGSLDGAMGGPEKDQNQGQIVPRRSIYFRHAKEKEMVFTKLFDGPGVSECYQRDESIVPQQALALANSPLAKSQARLLAKDLSREYTETQSAEFIAAAFERVLTRRPTDDELSACSEFLLTQARLFEQPSQLTTPLVGEPGTVPAATDPRQRARENFVHVLINHHDFVTVR